MTISCISCRRSIESDYKACPYCGEPLTDFVRQFSDRPIDGKYEIVSRLGAGGMGDVYKVRHIHLDSIRVIKLMRANIAGDPSSHERFLREAKLATLIHHPNVSVLHDFATLPDGTAYMVWEFIAGTNLAEVLNDRGRLSPRFAAELSIEALHGLDAVHRAGIVHRDISPENLMLTRDESGVEHVKIIDLGIAKGSGALDGATQTGMFVGKWKYASPEHLGALADGERIDGRADLYSFGVVMYEMLSGRPPFIAQTPHQYIVMHTKESPPPNFMSPAEDAGTRKLQDLVLKSLAKSRNDRFANAREFALALQALLPELPDTPMDEDRASDATMIVGATQATERTPLSRPSAPATVITNTVRSSEVKPARAPVSDTVVAGSGTQVAAAPATRPATGGRRVLAIAAISLAALILLVGGGLYLFLRKESAAPVVDTSASAISSTTIASTTTTGTLAGAAIDVTSSSMTESSATSTTATTATTPVAGQEATPAARSNGPAPAESRSSSRPIRGSQPVGATAGGVGNVRELAEEEEENEEEEPAPSRGGDRVAPAKISSRARYFTASSEYKGGISRGIIQSHDDMIAGSEVNWFALAPRVQLSEHKIRVGSVRNLSSVQNQRIVAMLKNDLQTYLDEVTEPSKGALTTDLGIYWAEDDADKKRGVGVEAVFRDGSGNVVAKLRHAIRENSPEDAMEEMIEAIGDFVEDHDVFQPR